jgi:hypothetical protein
MNCEECWRKRLWPTLEVMCRYLPEGTRKPWTVSEYSCPCRNSDWEPLKHKLEALPMKPTCSVVNNQFNLFIVYTMMLCQSWNKKTDPAEQSVHHFISPPIFSPYKVEVTLLLFFPSPRSRWRRQKFPPKSVLTISFLKAAINMGLYKHFKINAVKIFPDFTCKASQSAAVKFVLLYWSFITDHWFLPM